MWGTWALAPPQLTADRSVNSSLWHINMCQYILSDMHISSFNPWNKEEILEKPFDLLYTRLPIKCEVSNTRFSRNVVSQMRKLKQMKLSQQDVSINVAADAM